MMALVIAHAVIALLIWGGILYFMRVADRVQARGEQLNRDFSALVDRMENIEHARQLVETVARGELRTHGKAH